jgi:hypothetical protein
MDRPLLLVLIDKGLLAAVLAVSAFWLSKRLERFRSSLARATELARERLQVARAVSAQCRELEHRLLEFRSFKEVVSLKAATRQEPLPLGDRGIRNYDACEAAIYAVVRLTAECEVLFEPSITAKLSEVVVAAKALLFPQRTSEEIETAYDRLGSAIRDALGAFRSSLGGWQ